MEGEESHKIARTESQSILLHIRLLRLLRLARLAILAPLLPLAPL